MAIVIESVATQTYTAPSGNDLTITKPTGLAIGDLMIACVSHFAEVDNVNTPYSTPSGWTSAENESHPVGSDGMAYAMFYRVATSGDTAASNFTFSVLSGQEYVGGCIMRVSGIRTDVTELGAVSSQFLSNTDNPSYTVSLSPAQDVILYVAMFSSGATPYNTTDVTITGTNPTWTQQFDTTQTISVSARFEVFTAIDATPAASVTALTPTETGSGAGTDSYGSLAFYLGRNDATTTPTFTTTGNTAFAPAGQAGAQTTLTLTETTNTAFTPTGRGSTETDWTNDTVDSTAWTNDTI